MNEAFALLGEDVDEDRVGDAARALYELGPEAVVITGGHTSSGADLLYDGKYFVGIEGPVHSHANTHGAGCTHSSSLASFLALGHSLEEAARRARAVASEAVEYGLARDRGRGRPGSRPGKTTGRSRTVKSEEVLHRLSEGRPLVHHITNYVTV